MQELCQLLFKQRQGIRDQLIHIFRCVFVKKTIPSMDRRIPFRYLMHVPQDFTAIIIIFGDRNAFPVLVIILCNQFPLSLLKQADPKGAVIVGDLLQQISSPGTNYIGDAASMLEEIADIFHFAQEIFPATVRQECNSDYFGKVTLLLTSVYDIPPSGMSRNLPDIITF
jgi:hypothetical protein